MDWIYFDHSARPQYYGAVKSADPGHRQAVSAGLSPGARHGTALRATQGVVAGIQEFPINPQKP
jgi:hypothetical protein